VEPTRLPDDTQIVGPNDPWSFQLLLDPAKNWSGSTFVVDSPRKGVTVSLDTSHKADEGTPYITLSLTADRVIALGAGTSFVWNLNETPVLGRTFAQQQVNLVAR